METEVIVDFVYKYKNYDGNETTIRYPINIPYKDDYKELSHQIIKEKMDEMMGILDEHEKLKPQLKSFIDEQNQNFYDSRDEHLINLALTNEIDTESVIKKLEKQYKEEILEFADRIGPSDEEIFAQSFHRLIHSPTLPELLEREKGYAKIVSEYANRMDTELTFLIQQQENEIKYKLEELDVSATSDDINRLITKQCGKRDMIQKGYQSELEAIKGHQRNEYRHWITSRIGDSLLIGSPVPTPIGHKSSMFVTQTPSMEESFTIHLGSQLKHMHNIRILSANVKDLCSPIHNEESLSGMNIALSIYSSSLCGIVVLTPPGHINADPEIMKNANMSTEFHFDQIDDQLNRLENDLRSLNRHSNSGGKVERPKLRAGDFFITKHSNLSQSHIIFHLISDEPFQSPTEINSRHPVILGLRNILKVASKHDVTMLTIPALLRHEMSEEMTVSWCMRRAELVFKCAKGFMIESASWGGTELSTLQLLLPNEISEDLFNTLAGMVPTVFRVANAKIFEATTE